MIKKYTLILLVSACSYSFAQDLSVSEKKIIRRVEANHEASIRFLEETVNINSGSQNPEGVRRVGQLYSKFLEDLGFATSWIDMPTEMNRGGHLIAELKGNKGKRLLLIGHMDTVFEEDSPFQKWERKDSIAIGPGTSDMKGGNMVLLYALKVLHEAGELKDRQIVVILHGDEESPGRPIAISRKDIVALAKRSDAALAFENGTGFEYATVARRGSSSWTLEVQAKQAHSSGIFSENSGAGAIYEASRILNRFYEELQEENLTFNPGLIAGGTQVLMDSSGIKAEVSGKTNLIANRAVVQGDLRSLTTAQLERARTKMKAIVADHLPHAHAEISFRDGYAPMPPTEGNLALLAVLNKVSLDMKLGEVKAFDPGKRGAGDVSFIATYVDVLDGLGVQGGGAHAPGEFVDLHSVEAIVKRTAILFHRLTNN
ncbi:M20/M25/M40 family metallo-hydrolase [Olivibacter sitiensis]|uniref:M20/M25/M40 family metallo-hydrolase n=1 Tax=Olivibacter sitiensis TaxID=376470 RepID=UPI0003FCC066|nr:M20/M25/M40 family metallo-hydrolase [Olivibacter sitiensis]